MFTGHFILYFFYLKNIKSNFYLGQYFQWSLFSGMKNSSLIVMFRKLKFQQSPHGISCMLHKFGHNVIPNNIQKKHLFIYKISWYMWTTCWRNSVGDIYLLQLHLLHLVPLIWPPYIDETYGRSPFHWTLAHTPIVDNIGMLIFCFPLVSAVLGKKLVGVDVTLFKEFLGTSSNYFLL